MILDIFGIIAVTILSGLRLGQVLLGQWWTLPLFLHGVLAAILLVLHRKPERLPPLLQRLTAWGSALLPLLVRIKGNVPFFNQIASMAGVAVAIWAMVVLGRSFDVSPADRGLVNQGPYRIVRHPMYASELISIFALVAVNPDLQNLVITLALIITSILRIHWEEKFIRGYSEYSRQVHSRLVPGVW